MIDTGCDAGVTLPAAYRRRLNLTPTATAPFELADGSRVMLDVYEVEVEVDGLAFHTEAVFSTSDEVLIGAKAMAGCRLTIDYPAGTVTLQRTRP